MSAKKNKPHSRGTYAEMSKALNAALERLGVPQQSLRERMNASSRAAKARRQQQRS